MAHRESSRVAASAKVQLWHTVEKTAGETLKKHKVSFLIHRKQDSYTTQMQLHVRSINMQFIIQNQFFFFQLQLITTLILLASLGLLLAFASELDDISTVTQYLLQNKPLSLVNQTGCPALNSIHKNKVDIKCICKKIASRTHLCILYYKKLLQWTVLHLG